MYQKRQDIENAIAPLKLLLSNDSNNEEEFQQWLENNPIVFNALNYTNFIAHPVLQLQDGESLIPDFLVQRVDGLWEIFELKLPNTKILKDKKTRQTFYAPLNEYIQQCIDYSNYFSDRENREKFFLNTGISIKHNPRAKLIAGINEGLERYKVEQRLGDRGHRVDLITYEDILNQLEFYKLNNFGTYESINGICFHLIVTLNYTGLKNRERNQLIMVGESPNKNCISLHIDSMRNLCFEIIDSSGTSYISKVKPGSNTFYYNKLMYCIIEFGKNENYSITSIEINGKYHSFNILNEIDIIINSNNLFTVIGSDCLGKSNSNFDLYEHIVFGKTFNLEDRVKMRENVFNYYFGKNISETPGIKFRGNQFLRSNFHPNFTLDNSLKLEDLVQPKHKHQPILFPTTNDPLHVSVFYNQMEKS